VIEQARGVFKKIAASFQASIVSENLRAFAGSSILSFETEAKKQKAISSEKNKRPGIYSRPPYRYLFRQCNFDD